MYVQVGYSTPLPYPSYDPPMSRAIHAPVPSEKRRHLRLDSAFIVSLESAYGPMRCVARNVSEGGMFLEAHDPLPLGAAVRVVFSMPQERGEIVALGEVKNHYFLNFSDDGHARSLQGLAVRFTGFEQDSAEVLGVGLQRMRILH